MTAHSITLKPLSIEEQVFINGGTDRTKEGEIAGEVAEKVVKGVLTLIAIAVLIL